LLDGVFWRYPTVFVGYQFFLEALTSQGRQHIGERRPFLLPVPGAMWELNVLVSGLVEPDDRQAVDHSGHRSGPPDRLFFPVGRVGEAQVLLQVFERNFDAPAQRVRLQNEQQRPVRTGRFPELSTASAGRRPTRQWTAGGLPSFRVAPRRCVGQPVRTERL
jgi:hypothetical protein